MITPYVTGFPADPKSFAGRERELEEIKKAIDYIVHSEPATPQNVAIVGDWGIGKTSLLNKSKTIALDDDCLLEIGGLVKLHSLINAKQLLWIRIALFARLH
jgi:ABC-type lipoprotein export system ATPase subunit